MLGNSFLNLNPNAGESSGVFKGKWILGQDLCDCVQVSESGSLLWEAWGVKGSELLTWEGCGEVPR